MAAKMATARAATFWPSHMALQKPMDDVTDAKSVFISSMVTTHQQFTLWKKDWGGRASSLCSLRLPHATPHPSSFLFSVLTVCIICIFMPRCGDAMENEYKTWFQRKIIKGKMYKDVLCCECCFLTIKKSQRSGSVCSEQTLTHHYQIWRWL